MIDGVSKNKKTVKEDVQVDKVIETYTTSDGKEHDDEKLANLWQKLLNKKDGMDVVEINDKEFGDFIINHANPNKEDFGFLTFFKKIPCLQAGVRRHRNTNTRISDVSSRR